MKSNFFTHKFLPILSILILVSLVFINNNVFAADSSSLTYPELPTIEGATDYDYMIAKYNSNGNIWLFLFYSIDSNLDVSHDIKANGTWATTNNTSSTIYLKKYYINNGEWSLIASDSINPNNFINVAFNAASQFDYYKSNFNIYNSDGSLFFLQTPLTLAGILEASNPVERFQIMMKNVAISLLLFVICYLGLRKAWKFLRTQLKGC